MMKGSRHARNSGIARLSPGTRRFGLNAVLGLLCSVLFSVLLACGGGGGGGGTSGTVTIAGNAATAGAVLTYTDGVSKTVTTDASGNFSITVPSGWSGTLTPALTRFSFQPSERTFANVRRDLDAQDFTAHRDFWTDTLVSPSAWRSSTFRLAYQNSQCNVWVLPRDEAGISQDLLEHYGDYFLNHSWPDVTTYVHEPQEFFGEPGGRINILFFRMAESYAGYFWNIDFEKDEDLLIYDLHSNETNVFYLNIDAAVDPAHQAFATLFTEGTLTHEFQHMCNAHYFYFDSVGSTKTRWMDTWADEFCSTTMETVFAGQMDVYIPDYQSSPDFTTGASDFLQWQNNFTQYTSASMLGTYLLSQVEAAKRPHLFKTFLESTDSVGSDPDTYTSVEDLLAALQDPQVAWAPGGWKTLTDFNATDVRDDWALLLKNFCIGLTGTNSAYNTYVAANSSQTIAPACIPTTAASYALKPSGWFIGKTHVPDTASTSIASATTSTSGTTPAYVFVYNGTIPTDSDLNDTSAAIASVSTPVLADQIVARPAAKAEAARMGRSRAINRASGPRRETAAAPLFRPAAMPSVRAAIPGDGNHANGGDSTAGYNYCGYTERPE